jgi:hypothetical protein
MLCKVLHDGKYVSMVDVIPSMDTEQFPWLGDGKPCSRVSAFEQDALHQMSVAASSNAGVVMFQELSSDSPEKFFLYIGCKNPIAFQPSETAIKLYDPLAGQLVDIPIEPMAGPARFRIRFAPIKRNLSIRERYLFSSEAKYPDSVCKRSGCIRTGLESSFESRSSAPPAKVDAGKVVPRGVLACNAQDITSMGMHKRGGKRQLTIKFIKRLASNVDPAKVKSMAMRCFRQEGFGNQLKEFSSIAAGMELQTTKLMGQLQKDFLISRPAGKKSFFHSFKQWAQLQFMFFPESGSESESEHDSEVGGEIIQGVKRVIGSAPSIMLSAEGSSSSDSDHDEDSGINSKHERGLTCMQNSTRSKGNEVTLAACGRFMWKSRPEGESIMLGGQGIETHIINLMTDQNTDGQFRIRQLLPAASQALPESIELDTRGGYRMTSRQAFKLEPISEAGDYMYLMWAKDRYHAELFLKRLKNRYSAIPPELDIDKCKMVGTEGYSNKRLKPEFRRELVAHTNHIGDCKINTCVIAAVYQVCDRVCRFEDGPCSNSLQHLQEEVGRNVSNLELRASIFQRSQVALYVKDGCKVEGCIGMYQGFVYDDTGKRRTHSAFSLGFKHSPGVKTHFYVDAEEQGNHTKFLQHRNGAKANCHMEQYVHPSGHPLLLLYTKGKLDGTGQCPVELSFDYGNTYNTEHFDEGPTRLMLNKPERAELHKLYWEAARTHNRKLVIAPQGHSMIQMDTKQLGAELEWILKLQDKAKKLNRRLCRSYWVYSEANAAAGLRQPVGDDKACEVITYSLSETPGATQGPLVPTYGTVAMLEELHAQGANGAGQFKAKLSAGSFVAVPYAHPTGSSRDGTMPSWHPGKS